MANFTFFFLMTMKKKNAVIAPLKRKQNIPDLFCSSSPYNQFTAKAPASLVVLWITAGDGTRALYTSVLRAP